MLSTPSRATIIVSCIFPVLAAVAVALRFYAKRLKAIAFRTDDYAVLLALIITIAICVLYIIGAAVGGIGVHVQDLPPHGRAFFNKVLFAVQFCYLANVALVRFSILLFYTQLFPSRKFRLTVYAMNTVICLWFVAFFFATLFQALPISLNWNMQPGTTINRYAMYTATAATETILNIATLVFPWPIVWRLKIDTKYKRLVSGIFLLGGFVCVSSIVRLYYLTQYLNPSAEQLIDFTYYLTNLCIWTAIEPCLGVICACLPVLGPVFQCGTSRAAVNVSRSNIGLHSYNKGRVTSPNLGKASTSAGSNESMARPFYKMRSRGEVVEAIELEVPV
ncbi:hypothetical protein MMC30_006634 [Trapelia coarctata]|nr:hypothetical protein [Trapelia coarctata]